MEEHRQGQPVRNFARLARIKGAFAAHGVALPDDSIRIEAFLAIYADQEDVAQLLQNAQQAAAQREQEERDAASQREQAEQEAATQREQVLKSLDDAVIGISNQHPAIGQVMAELLKRLQECCWQPGASLADDLARLACHMEIALRHANAFVDASDSMQDEVNGSVTEARHLLENDVCHAVCAATIRHASSPKPTALIPTPSP